MSASTLALGVFNGSINSFFGKDIASSNKNMNSIKELRYLCEKINNLALKQEGEMAISMSYVMESIRRIGEYAEDISETVINYLIYEEN